MNKTIVNTIIFIVIALFQLGATGCSSRDGAAVVAEDSTLVLPAKDPDGVSAKITLFRKMDKESGKMYGEGEVFSIGDKANIRALINIDSRGDFGGRASMFHIDWVDANGRSMHRKKIELKIKDSSPTLKSSISISPEKRNPGAYAVRLYYFRELIAEKRFEILPMFRFERDLGPSLSASITLYSRKSKKTDELIGEGTAFEIKKKAKVRALVELYDRYAYGKQELVFRCVWIGPENKPLFRKKVYMFPENSSNYIKSSIVIPPGKREPGEYMVKVYLFEKVIAEKTFVLF